MARYIDADKVMEEIKRIGGHNLCEWDTLGVKALINRQPTANVAPIADTVKKMRERLYRELAFLCAKDKFNKEYFLTEVDRVAKEMLEGK